VPPDDAGPAPVAGYRHWAQSARDVLREPHLDQRFDSSSVINDPTGNTRRDSMFNAEATGFVIDGGANGKRCGANPAGSGTAVHVSASGWCTLKHTFTDNGSGVFRREWMSWTPAATSWALDP
jgi:hypothetical protein